MGSDEEPGTGLARNAQSKPGVLLSDGQTACSEAEPEAGQTAGSKSEPGLARGASSGPAPLPGDGKPWAARRIRSRAWRETSRASRAPPLPH